MDSNKALAAVVETILEQVSRCQTEIQGFKSNAEEAQKTAQEAQRLLVNLISNLLWVHEQSHSIDKEGSEILDKMDEAKRIFDEAVEEMDEDQERQHRESLNELTELSPFYRLGNTNEKEVQKAEEGGKARGT